jgi:Mrp family chromosome partitioning ATPase
MAEAGTEPTLRGYVHVLSRGHWWIAACTLIGSGISLALSFSGPRMRSVIAELSRRFDIVLMDSPPVLRVADAMIVARYADAAIVVVATGQTNRAELRRTRDKLAQAGVYVIGAVMSKATAQDEHGYYSSSYRPYELKQNGHPLPAGQPGQSQN